MLDPYHRQFRPDRVGMIDPPKPRCRFILHVEVPGRAESFQVPFDQLNPHDPRTIAFGELPPEVAEFYEVRRLTAPFLVRKDLPSWDGEAK